MTVVKEHLTVAAEHTHNTAAGYIPRAPKCRNLVGVIYGDIGKGKLHIACVRGIASDTDDTAVTGVIYTGVTVFQSDVFEGCVCSIGSNHARGSEFTVRGKVVNRKVLDRTAVDIAKDTHCGIPIIAVIIALHLPCVLIDVLDGISIAIECAAEGATVGVPYNASVAVNHLRLALGVIGIFFEIKEFRRIRVGYGIKIAANLRISDGIEVDALVCVLCTAEVDIGKKLVVLLCVISVIVRDQLTKVSELVCVCDQVGILCRTLTACKSCCDFAVPSILGICNKRNLGEGLEIERGIAGGGIIGKAVMRRCCPVFEKHHFHGKSVLYMVETVVTHIETDREKCGQCNCHDNIVVLGDAVDMNIQGKCRFVAVKGDIRIALCLFSDMKRSLRCAAFHQNAGRHNTCHLTVTACESGGGSGSVFRVLGYCRAGGIGIDNNGIGPLRILIIGVSEGVALIGVLRCKKVERKAVADRLALVMVVRILVHMQSNGKNYLARSKTCLGFALGKENALGRGVGSNDIRQPSCARKTVKAIYLGTDRIDIKDLDNIGEVGHLTHLFDGELPFECQVSVIYYLNIFNIGVIGLPVIVGKNCRICGILPLARIGGKQGVRKIHLCVELTTGDNVIIACSRIGKPREGGSEKHRDA